jgi:kumamolisin
MIARARRTLMLGTSVALVAAAAAPVGVAATPRAVRLGSPPSLPAGAGVAGALPDSKPLDVTVMLEPQSGLAAYATAVSTPGSPLYHHYLTVAQFAQRFGPAAPRLNAVESSLRARGLQPGAVSANHLAIGVHATAGALANAFGTAFQKVDLPGRTAYRNTRAPLLDQSIAADVQSVIGLDSLQTANPLGVRAAQAQTRLAPHVVTGGPQACAAASNVGEYTADQIASAYRFSSMYGAGDLGTGQTIALYELESNSTSDIAAYQSCYGTSAPVSYVKVDSFSGTGAGSGEAALDIEDVIGLAPRASFLVYQGPNTNAGVIDTYNAIISQDQAKVISTSWGLCESQEGTSAASSENTLFQEAATQGQTIFAASGDSGSEDCGTNSLAVDDPGSQPFVTSVGGTTMPALGPPPTQSVWNNSSGAGGGGISRLWQMPSYQSGAPASLNVVNSGSSGTPCAAGAGGLCREVPDVSADADPNTGYAIFWKGSWIGIGGTSAAAPTWAGFTALVNGSSGCGGTPVGFANPLLYAAAGSAFSADFSDITSGNNDGTGTNGGKFAAGPGFDMATGLGTPVGSTLPAALCGGGGGGPSVSVTNPGNQTGTVGAPVSLQISASDTDQGALTYSATGLPAGLSINSSTGLISGTPTTATSSNVTVTATDATGPSGGASFTWTISAPICPARQLLVNPGFETGTAAPWTGTTSTIVPSSVAEPAHSGSFLAKLDGKGRFETQSLAQKVAVPKSCANYTFSFWLHIDTAQTGTKATDTLKVTVSYGLGTKTLDALSNLNAAPGYAQYSFSLAAYAGKTVTIKFAGAENGSLQTTFALDDTALNVS